MTTALMSDIYMFVLAILVGYEVITKVPSTLHTPLMSASNAIHGIVIIGAIITASQARTTAGYVLAFVAAFFAAMNVVGGYSLTDRMLQMFRKRPGPTAHDGGSGRLERSHERRQYRRGAGIPAGRGRVRGGPAPDELAGHRPPGQPAVLDGHDRRGGRRAGQRHPRRDDHDDRLDRPHHRRRRRRGGRPGHGQAGQDDRRAAGGQHHQRGRRGRRRPGGGRRLRPAGRRGRHLCPGDDRDRAGRHHRSRHLLRIADRRGQAAGLGQLAARGLPRGTPGHRRPRRHRRRGELLSAGRPRLHPGADPNHLRRPGLRRHDDDADRRRRHAGGHRAAELLHRHRRGRRRLRDQQWRRR